MACVGLSGNSIRFRGSELEEYVIENSHNIFIFLVAVIMRHIFIDNFGTEMRLALTVSSVISNVLRVSLSDPMSTIGWLHIDSM